MIEFKKMLTNTLKYCLNNKKIVIFTYKIMRL